MSNVFEADPAYSNIRRSLVGSARRGFDDAYFDLIYENAFSPYMLGPPITEQDDPRYVGAIKALYGDQHPDWSREHKKLHAKASEWTLLLQMTFTHWYGETSEGTLCFLIHEGDLKARRFEAAFAVYDQT